MIHWKKISILAIALLCISATTIKNDRLFEIAKNIDIFVNVYKTLNAQYVDDLDPSHLMRIGIDAMVGSLDPYTNFISEAQVESYRISTEGKYQGIGAIVKKIDDYVTIVEPYAGSAVIKAGLEAGDQIISIEGKSTKGKSQEEVTTFFRGIPGTNVQLGIRRDGTPDFDVDIVRGQVSIPNVPYSGFVGDKIGYVALTTFTADAGKNIRKAIRELKNEDNNIKGLILDLRSNGGGLLKEAISVSNIFVPQNQEVVSVKSKVRERNTSYKTLALPLDLDIPLVVLINKTSASASEIVSGVIQDMDRGVLMGQRSYGKGLVQNTQDVGYNSRVKVTTSKYYIPSGRCIQSVEYKDGEPVDIADVNRSKFKTKGGRTVLDGGGVTPDIKLEPAKVPEVLKALQDQYFIFKYADQYVADIDTTGLKVEEIVFTDYEEFKGFVQQKEFEYESKNEKLLKEVIDNLKVEDNAAITTDVNAVSKKIEISKASALDANKQDIVDAIELEIATQLHLQEGKVYQKLKDDKEIVKAVELLLDTERYSSILK